MTREEVIEFLVNATYSDDECDQCGWSIEEYVIDYNFCPNCGARMDKGGDTE